ncbi:S8 family serine peptidase [Jiangella sp. DSM 45060]|uniref:S8 family peptidase n=1 Tax=Jiangella sp. DSM 45060 TaxID=1798224 RepID=UPI00087AE9E4|nr:S8 family serine peptidase [Jiangella sp. DSM 45060]SDT68329.1 Subtilase family protein [Jiangella sp. DSM 45060]
MPALRRTAAALALALATLPLSGQAAAPADDPPATPLPQLPDGVESGGVRTVTLITGDVAVLTYGRDGAPAVRVQSDDPGGYDVRTEGDDVYVIPASAEQALAENRVDRQLFNVTGLVEQSLDDASTGSIPLIVTYAGGAAASRGAALPAGTERTASLPSIGADVLDADKAVTESVWNAVVPQPTAFGRQVEKIWLDARVAPVLDESVPYVGAPDAWAAGFDGAGSTVAVLDTGIDAEHPDVADALVVAENFTDSPDAVDRDGHGTHVASTVLGSGAASGGDYRGVAPGAGLLVGKVLGDDGFGELSWIIAGMEWAVAQGADVVNMSLGNNELGACDDPMVQAVDALSAASDTLFVIAAGNLGGPAETVTSPGCAASALTVAAVDLTDATASFSGRGPVAVTRAVKPDIAGPGVDITAARAGGRGDAAYTDMSGTSMATPHVAGAAAVVRQAHPDWTGEQVKAALQSTVRPDNDTDVYDQGAGILDVAKAATAQLSGPGTVDLGTLAWPHEPAEAVTTDVVYTNTGDADATLTFTLDARGENGAALPDDAATLGATTLTVPAGGTAALPVTFDPSVLDYGHYGAVSLRLVARDGDATVVTPIGAYAEPQQVDVTFRVIGRDGEPAGDGSTLDVFDLDSIAAQRISLDGADVTLRLRAGTYSIASTVAVLDPETFQVTEAAFLAEPELRLLRDRTVTLDARRALPVKVRTDQPMRMHSGSVSYARIVDNWILSNTRYFREGMDTLYLGRMADVERGAFDVTESWLYTTPDGGTDYHLVYPHTGAITTRDVNHRVEQDQLARIDSTYNTPGSPDRYAQYLDAYSTQREAFVPLGDVIQFDAPGTRTSYVTADVPVRQTVIHPDGTMWYWGTPMSSATRPLDPGSTTAETWYGAGLRPAVPADAQGPYDPSGRIGNLIWTNLPAWADSQPGHFAWNGLNDLGSMELFANGQSLGAWGWYGQGQWDVPAAATDLALVYDLVRFDRSHSTWQSPLFTQTSWRFTSSAADGGALPLLFPTYDVEVDGQNRAAAVDGYRVEVGVEATPSYEHGSLTGAAAWVSYDDGETWAEVPATLDGDTVVATVDNRPAAGGYVSVKVELTEANGVGVTQWTQRLYGVV